MAFFDITGDRKAVAMYLTGSAMWTSALRVQAKQRINIGILIGSFVSDMLSAYAFSTTISGMVSTLSASIILQRRMREDTNQLSGTGDADWAWRDVEDWTVLSTSGASASEENISTTPEPEPCEYRIGCGAGQWDAGTAILRLGTS